MPKHHLSRRQRRLALQEDTRFRILHALGGTPDLSQRGLARESGVSLGAVNALLNGMIEAGLVQIGSGGPAPAKFRISYVLTEAGRAEVQRLSKLYLARRRAERAALDTEIADLEATFGADASS